MSARSASVSPLTVGESREPDDDEDGRHYHGKIGSTELRRGTAANLYLHFLRMIINALRWSSPIEPFSSRCTRARFCHSFERLDAELFVAAWAQCVDHQENQIRVMYLLHAEGPVEKSYFSCHEQNDRTWSIRLEGGREVGGWVEEKNKAHPRYPTLVRNSTRQLSHFGIFSYYRYLPLAPCNMTIREFSFKRITLTACI